MAETPLRTDYSDTTPTDQGTHAEAHNEVNAAVNRLRADSARTMMLMGA